jgi:AcrR family transcriptional regulator
VTAPKANPRKPRATARPAKSDKPAGPDEVREAILDAAMRLMEQRAGTDVSLREIAREANVNHGLVHRYFGTRNDVLTAVFRKQSQRGATLLTQATHIDEALSRLQTEPATKTYARLLAAALLDGVEPAEIAAGHSFRHLLELLQAVDTAPATTKDSTTAVAAAVCLILGWGVFGDFITASADLKGKQAQAMTKALVKILRDIVTTD